MATKKTNIPLAKMMTAIDRNDFDFYANLTPAEKKAFSPWMAMRYTSSAKGMDAYHYLLMVNDIVNVDFNVLKKHPELQWKLLCVCGKGSNAFHPWIPPGKGNKKVSKLANFLHEMYPTYNRKEIELVQELNSKDDLKQLARDHGMDDKAIKELFK